MLFSQSTTVLWALFLLAMPSTGEGIFVKYRVTIFTSVRLVDAMTKWQECDADLFKSVQTARALASARDA